MHSSTVSLPQTTREYRLPKVRRRLLGSVICKKYIWLNCFCLQIDGFHNLTLQEAPIPKLKSIEVLVKVHAVSLQYRDLLVAQGQYPMHQKENPVPVSDMAGEIIALGEDVKGWKVGERVSPNFATDHLFGDVTKDMTETSLGAPVDGVLTEYKVLPAHVSGVLEMRFYPVDTVR